mgnify:CR=1 FL=1
MSDILKFESSMKAYQRLSPINETPECLPDFIRNAEKVQRKVSFEKKLDLMQNFIVYETQLPTFVEEQFLPHFQNQIDIILKNNEMKGIIEISRFVIDSQIDFLALAHIDLSPYDLLEKSLEFVKSNSKNLTEMEWEIIKKNKNTDNYKIKLILNEVILFPKPHRIKIIDGNMVYLLKS